VKLVFVKAHGLGNDFILVETRLAPPAAEVTAWARRLCDRHTGIGGDGVLLYGPAADGARMRLLNADGSDGEVSGNGLRCLAALAAARGLAGPRHVVNTPPGPRPVEVERVGPNRFRVRTDLGPAMLKPVAIPVALGADEPGPVVDHPLTVGDRIISVTATSLGNPHCAVFGNTVADDQLLHTLGPALEEHWFFPRRTNVEFVTVVSRTRLRVRFWERGVGYTRASGTGAASAAVAAMLKGWVDRHVTVECDGGELDVEWPDPGANVRQVGEVELLFDGEWLG
jgi:diaminopimelate epimerase